MALEQIFMLAGICVFLWIAWDWYKKKAGIKIKKSKTWEIASHETIFDALKWISFMLFYTIYTKLNVTYPLKSYIFLGLFIGTLLLINKFKVVKENRIKKIFKRE